MKTNSIIMFPLYLFLFLERSKYEVRFSIPSSFHNCNSSHNLQTMVMNRSTFSIVAFILHFSNSFSQEITTPIILEVIEDDDVATII